MRIATFGLMATSIALSGCGQREGVGGAGPKSQGRYSGIGTFEAGRLWREMTHPAVQSDPAAARLDDDEQIIVVIDSHTGEVRQCGNHSGFCVTTNPWAGSGAPSGTPVKLSKHASDLDAEASAETAESATNEAAPARQ
jgi:hypothetical protein